MEKDISPQKRPIPNRQVIQNGLCFVIPTALILLAGTVFYFPLCRFLVSLMEAAYKQPFVFDLCQRIAQLFHVQSMQKLGLGVLLFVLETIMCAVMAYGFYRMEDHTTQSKYKKIMSYLVILILCRMGEYIVVRILFLLMLVAATYIMA